MSRWIAALALGDPALQIASTLAPGVSIMLYVSAGLVVYSLRNRSHGQFRDQEMDQRGLGGLTTPALRHFFAWLMRPLWRGAVAAQIPPNAITTLSLGLSMGAGFGVATGQFALGGWLFLAAGLLDFLDGRVARETGRVTKAGAALDSVLDRYAEAALLVGLAWYYRSSWVLMPALLAVVGSQMVPYVRARGEALGATLKDVGFMQRPERIAVLGLSCALAPVLEALLEPELRHPPHRLAAAALVLLAITSHATAIQRLLALLRALSVPALRSRATFVRAVAVSFIATVTDLVTATIAQGVLIAPATATLIGCISGGAVAFASSRSWVFGGQRDAPFLPVRRFLIVWVSTAVLNTGGVWLVLQMPGTGFLGAWLLTRSLVYATWNYPLLRDYVLRSALARAAELASDAPLHGSGSRG